MEADDQLAIDRLADHGKMPGVVSPQSATAGSSGISWLAWLGGWVLRLAEFGAVQAVVQACMALAGLVIVRNLPKEDYALFAIVNSMQTTANVLADLGIGIGLRSIGGHVWQDPQRFGQLLNTALGLRRQFAAGSLLVTLPLAAWMLWRNGAQPALIVGLCLCLAAGVIPLLGVSVNSVCLQMHAQYRRMQQLDLGNAGLRLGLLAALAVIQLNALLAAAVGVLGSWIQWLVGRRWVRECVPADAGENAADRRELIRLSLKSLPNSVFFCFQGQITLLILTMVGNRTGIADLTAIGRLSALFTVFSAVFLAMVGPKFAQCQDPERLPRLYRFLVGGTALVLAPFMLLAWFLPGPLLWLLGAQYSGLETECVWVMAAGCAGQIVGVVWNLNSSRAWIQVQSLGYIPSILLIQLLAAISLDLHSFHGVLIFNFVSVAAPLPVFACDAWLGMRRPVGILSKRKS